MLSSVDDVVQAFESDPRLGDWSVEVRGEGYLEIRRAPVIAILAWPEVWRDRDRLRPHLVRARSGNYSLILVGTDRELEEGRVDQIGDEHAHVTALSSPMPPAKLALIMRSWGEADRLRLELANRELEFERARYENDLLIDIGRSLGKQRNIRALLDLILCKAREVTGADAGSVYVVEGDAEDVTQRKLRFMEAQNDSMDMVLDEFTMPVSPSSIVGACVLSGKVVNIPDLYALDAPGTGNNPWSFVHDRSFDEKHGYQTRSMVTVPMISARNQVIGIIQLINKRARGVTRLEEPEDFEAKVLPFDEVSINYANSLAAQAGIALENSLLYDELRTLFEGFVHASVTAIEARDPTTSGHSMRVADLTVELARVADRASSGRYADLRFDHDEIKQIEFAALLHDFGKVGVREHVLVKAEKLYEHERRLIEARFDFIRRSVEADQLRRKVTYLMESSRAELAEAIGEVDRDAEDRLREIDELLLFILEANRPTVLERSGFERIAEIAARTYLDPRGEERPYLTTEESAALQIARGSLTVEERREIESHVVHTYEFLKRIPWGRTFRDIPIIAGAHHEKLDGTGYPRGLSSEEIPVPAKIMTISDIYDALTASDRPYKKAVPVPKALDILADEVKRGKLDAELWELFLEAKVWQTVGH
jgi:HD-GYP domain-containing protein (c-di-GMP phosphodiesterase class II)